MKYEIDGHRCFKIPREKLDLFLIALRVNFSSSSIFHEMKFVFVNEHDSKLYDVVVTRYGSYPFVENQLEEFVVKMNKVEVKEKEYS